jgi:hypothetical protein
MRGAIKGGYVRVLLRTTTDNEGRLASKGELLASAFGGA